MGVQSKAVQSINYTCDRCSSKKTVEIAIDVPDTGLMFNGIPAEVEADNMPLDYRETSILGVKYLLCASCAEVNYDLMKMFLSNSDVDIFNHLVSERKRINEIEADKKLSECLGIAPMISNGDKKRSHHKKVKKEVNAKSKDEDLAEALISSTGKTPVPKKKRAYNKKKI